MMNSRRSSRNSTSLPRNNEPVSRSYTIWMIFSVLLWCLFLVFIHIVPPNHSQNILAFFVLIFSTLLSTFLVLISNRKLCFILSLYFISLLLLLFFHQLNTLNLILISSLWTFLFFFKKIHN